MQVKSIAECSKEHSAILSTFIKLPFVIKICVLSTFEWPLKTGLTVNINISEADTHLFQDWERSLQNQEGPVEQVRLSYARLGMSSPQAESKVEFINQKWDQMISLGSTYADR